MGTMLQILCWRGAVGLGFSFKIHTEDSRGRAASDGVIHRLIGVCFKSHEPVHSIAQDVLDILSNSGKFDKVELRFKDNPNV